MKRVKILKRLMLFILCIATAAQCGFVMPVFAAGETYDLFVHYMTGEFTIGSYTHSGIRSVEHPVIVPPFDGDNTAENLKNQMINNANFGAIGIGETPNIPAPYRVLGYTFEGWYYNLDFSASDPYKNATQYTGGAITEEMVDTLGDIQLYAKWGQYHSADITSGSVKFTMQNDNGDFINDPVIWTDEDGKNGTEEFKLEDGKENDDGTVVDYYGYVYGDVSKIKMEFEQYDPGRVEIVEYTDPEMQDEDHRIVSYENQATTTVHFNNDEENITAQDIKLSDLGKDYNAYIGYTTDDSEAGGELLPLENAEELVTGVNITTADYMTLNKTQDYTEAADESLPEENTIEVLVTMPEHDDPLTGQKHQVKRTYRFHIKRLDMELKPEYGNTPYGRIMETMKTNPDEAKTQETYFHEHDHTYSGYKYNIDAWNIYGLNGKNVPVGSTPGENEFINYDEDETAIVVTEGEKFKDPGVLLYKNGEPVKADNITRTIHYTTVDSLRYGIWDSPENNPQDKHDISTITSVTEETESGDDAVVSILKDKKYVKPGIYTIDYEYTPEGLNIPIRAHRSMIVIPRQDSKMPYHFDINMDNYINALDLLIYDRLPEKDHSIIENVFLYRMFDVDYNGTVDETDKDHVMKESIIKSNIYPSLAVTEEEASSGKEYTVPELDTGKTQLYMDFLGTDASALADMTPKEASEIEKTPLKKGDVFYIGYRFDNVANLTNSEIEALLHEIVISTSFDTRYLQLERLNSESLSEFLKTANPKLFKDGKNLFNITMTSIPYYTDKSTAFVKWNNIGDAEKDPTNIAGYNPNTAGTTSSVTTTRIEMFLNHDDDHDAADTYELKDNEYLLKLPVRVVNIPPQGERYTKYGDTSIERKTISAKLGANCLNFAFGNIYGYMWDMDRALNTSVTENLLDKLQYMGDITPVFDKEGEPQIIEMEYKEFGAHSVEQGIFEGDLPAGITYSAGHLYGTPEKAGEYEFYINGVRYKMVVNKKRMEVRANDNTMTYGDDLPDLKYEFNEEDLAEGDKTEDQHFPTPTVSCEVNNRTEVGRYDITISGDKEADNYYFVYVDGTMTVTQRPITVTNIKKTMPDYYVPESDNPDLTTQNISLNDIAIYSKGEFTVDNIVNDDDIRIRYTVKFDSYVDAADTTAKERECNVTVTVTGISSSYEKGRNYVLQPSPQTISGKTAMIKKGSINDFYLISEPAINYTYGDKINLDSGLISVTIKTGTAETDVETESCTFREAMAKGIKLTLVRADGSSVELNTDSYYIPTVSEDNDKAHIEISCQTGAEKKIPCTTLHVEPMQITVRADDKERFYGDNNEKQLYPLNNPSGEPGGLTYSITNGKIVNRDDDDTQQKVLTDYIEITTEEPTYEIHQEDLNPSTGKGSTLVPITLKYNGTNQNYEVTVEEQYDKNTNPKGSRLEIKQRPLYITELTAPMLTAPDYIDSDGTHNPTSKLIAGYALAGTGIEGDENNLGIVLKDKADHEGLCAGDAVKIGYRVRYNDTEADTFDKINISIINIGMDVNYGESRNYYIATDSNEEINTIKGDKEIRRINNIDVIHEIEKHYTFGEEFNLLRGEKQQTVDTDITRPEEIGEDDSWLRITYNTGEVSDITFKELCESFTSNDEYNKNLDFNITIKDSEPKQLDQLFMTDFNKDNVNKHFNAGDNISVSLGIKGQAPAWTGTITVSRKQVDVRVDNKSYLYHERPVDFAYTAKPDSADFRWGQTADVIPAGNYKYTCLEDDNVTETSNNTPSGIYTINLSVEDTDNYTFNCISGTLSIRQRPLIITDIKVPLLSAQDARDGTLSKSETIVWTGSESNITFADGFAPLAGETITINYTYRYTENPRDGGNVPVALSGITIDRLKGDARNYYLQSVASQTTGTVESAYITKLETTEIRGKTDGRIDPGKTEKYVYGDTLDLSGMTFIITYNTGASENITDIKDLAKYGVKAEYYKDGVKQDTAVEDGVFLTRDYDGMSIKLSLADDNENSEHKDDVNVDKAVTGNVIKVGKRTIHVGVNDSSYTYGDNPPSETEYGTEAVDGKYTYYLHKEDFPVKIDKTQAEFLEELINGGDEGYTPPTVSVRTQNGAGGAPDNTTDVGEAIQISADVSHALSDNYVFESDGKNGTLTVKPREIKATAINSSVIPTLTAEIAYKNGNTPPITIPNNSVTVTYGAEDNGITVENMVKGGTGDKVAFTFDVVYNSVTDTGEAYADVDITKFAMTDEYDAKNYILSEDVPTKSQGKIVTTRVSAVTITNPPKLTYTYGELLSIDGTVQIDYTSGEKYTVPMNRLYEYGMELLFVKAGTDGFIASDGNEYTDLTGSLGKPEVNKLLTVDGYNGVKLCVKPGDGVRVENEGNKAQYICVTDEIKVAQKNIRLSADNLEMTYGDSVPEAKWSYNQTDLVNGDTLTSSRFTVNNTDFKPYDSEKHRNYIYITEDGSESGTPVSGSTAVGSYDIKWVNSWSGVLDNTANYKIETVDGTLTVNKKPLKISGILNVPNLTPEIISEHGATVPITIPHTAKYPDKDYNGNPLDNFEFEPGFAPLEGDEIEISYDAVYKTMRPGEATTVDILNVRVTDYGKGGNYTVETAPTTADGMVSDTNISEIELLSDPVMRDDDDSKQIEYVYGDGLNLDRGLVKLTYDNGMSINVNFNSLEDISNGVISLVYCDDNGNNLADYEEPYAGQTLYVTKHNGRHIKISVPEDSGIFLKYMGAPTDKLRTNAIKVNKAPLKATVVADETSRIYGDENPTFRFEYSGFRNDDDAHSENFTAELVEPTIDCGASVSSPVGEYTVKAYGGESANYYCAEFEDTTISVTPRPLDVEAITGGIPALTSKIIRDNPGPIYTIVGYALNTAGQLTLNNLVPNDVIRVSYDATYASADHEARDVTVAISNMSIMDYGAGKNYELRNTPSIASGGRVYTQKIAGVDIMNQPKTEYTYGEYIDLTQPGVKIVYDDGEVLNDVPYDQVEHYDIDLNITYFDKNGSEVTERALDLVERQEQFEDGTVTEGQQKLDLTCFNGAYFTLVPKKDDTIDSPSLPTANSIRSKVLTVNPKVINVNIGSASSVYGEDPTPLYEFEYGDDFVYGETADDVITASPTFTCTDLSGADVGVTTEVGEYAIRMTGAAADNYAFNYNNGTLTITPRSLTVSNITNGIPALTADVIKESMGSIHYIPASATSSQMECDRVNDDDIKINYSAVYSSEEKNDSYNVGIADMELEDGYGRNKNYTLNKDASVKVVEGGGRINDKQITEIKITEQPRLTYTYGETFDANGGKVHIVYDTGYEDDVTFAELADYRITPEYYDTASAAATGTVHGGDRITVSAHNGKVIRLTASSTYEVEAQYTEPLAIAKRVLEYGNCIVNPIEYDGATTLTTGTVVFSNTQYEDNVTASAVFNFDDFRAGTNKTVYITDIRLDGAWTENYSLSSDSVTSVGTINKAKATLTLPADNVYLSPEDNSITVTAPEMTSMQREGGAKYQYSVDGGVTWSDDNVFTGLELGREYSVSLRLAETDNYAATDPTESISVTTYKVRFTLSANETPAEGEERRILKRFYTNTETVENEEALRALIGAVTETDENGEEREVTYYTLYDAVTGGTMQFPFSFIPEGETTADVNVYTSLTAARRSGGGGGSSAGGGFVGVIISFTDKDGKESENSSVTVGLDEGTLKLSADVSSIARNAVVTWSSDNPDVASVNSLGTVKLLGVGTATITAEAKGYRNAEKDTITITVVDTTPDATPSPTVSPDPGDSDKRVNIPYLHGFDNMIKPDDSMTRAEAATIMLQLAGGSDGTVYENIFADVRDDAWYKDIIAEAAAKGFISGYDDGLFRPEETVTREQFAAMTVKLAGLEPIYGSRFADVDADRWSAGSINTAVENGIITGYEDGTFLPENPIRRSEAVRMANAATGRIPNKAAIDAVECPYIDLPASHWAYYEFMAAAAEYEIP